MTQPILSKNAEKFIYEKRANGQPSAFYVGHTPDMAGIYKSRTRAGTMTPGEARRLANKLNALADDIEHESIYLD